MEERKQQEMELLKELQQAVEQMRICDRQINTQKNAD